MNDQLKTSSLISFETAEELYENAPCGYMSTLLDGHIVRVNQTFLDQTGYTAADLVNLKRLEDLLTVPGRVFYSTHFAPIVAMQGFANEIAVDIVCPGRSPMPVLMNAARVVSANGAPDFIRFTIFEATKRRRFEADLLAARRRSEMYEMIVRISADAILSVSPDGIVRWWNGAAEEVFEISAGDAVGRHVNELIVLENGDEFIGASMADLRIGKSTVGIERCLLPSGEAKVLAYTLTPHIEPPDELTGFSAILKDVTERRRAEDAERQRQLTEGHVKAQEEERRRISRDLHDQIGGNITAIHLGIASVMSGHRLPAAAREKLDAIAAKLLQMDRDVTFLAFEMRPPALQQGLLKAIENLTAEWERNYGVTIGLHSSDVRKDRRTTGETDAAVYRMAQEALNNIGKHASASHVSIILNIGDERVDLIIEDDGVGFDFGSISADHTRSGHGSGLGGMTERAELLGGTLEIESTPGAGTTIYARIPTRFD